MTLIYTLVTQGTVYQASDRLLTLAGTGAAHDAASNKTIVVHGRSFTATISYTGVGYMRGLPTDEYLVRELVGLKRSDSLTALTGWDAPRHFHAQYVLARLASAIDRACAAQPALAKHNFGLNVGGLQRTSRNGVRPFLASVTRSGPAPALVTFHRANRNQRDTFQLQTMGAVDAAELLRLRARLKESLHATPLEQLLVESVVNVSRSSRTVGSNVMLVQLRTGFDVVAEYKPLVGHASPFHRPQPPLNAYTPALVTPAFARAASLSYAREGDLRWRETDGFSFTISGPALESRPAGVSDGDDGWVVAYASSTQVRTAPPR